MEQPETRRTNVQSTAERARAAAMSDTDSTAPSVPVVRVAGYEIIDVLGRGGMGAVYKARQFKLNRVVALKTVLVPEMSSAQLLRFQREAVSLARLQHPNIVAVYDSGSCDLPRGQVFFAMELLHGEDLRARLDRAGRLSERDAWSIARQVAAALAHAAVHGIVHRDIKPANLFLVPPPVGMPLPDGVPFVKVTDFGIASDPACDDRPSPDSTAGHADARLTMTGAILGTPAYMAPEQCAGRRVDHRADIYALGSTVYHALTGAPPFGGRTAFEVMRQKESAPAPRLPLPFSAETADLVAAMLGTDPNDRPRDYGELIDRIDALPCLAAGVTSSRLVAPVRLKPPTETPAPSASSVTVPEFPSSPDAMSASHAGWLYGLAVAAAVAVAAALAVYLYRPPPRPTVPTAAAPPTSPSEPERRIEVPGMPGHQTLLRPGTLFPWTGDGGMWDLARDDEMVTVVTGTGGLVRAFDFPLPARFKVAVEVGPHKADAVDLVVATGLPKSGTRWLVRVVRTVDGRGTVTFGKQVWDGPFEPIGQPRPAEWARGGYLEMSYERADGFLNARVGDESLGKVRDADLRTTELRVQATGTVRIRSAELIDLAHTKK